MSTSPAPSSVSKPTPARLQNLAEVALQNATDVRAQAATAPLFEAQAPQSASGQTRGSVALREASAPLSKQTRHVSSLGSLEENSLLARIYQATTSDRGTTSYKGNIYHLEQIVRIDGFKENRFLVKKSVDPYEVTEKDLIFIPMENSRCLVRSPQDQKMNPEDRKKYFPGKILKVHIVDLKAGPERIKATCEVQLDNGSVRRKHLKHFRDILPIHATHFLVGDEKNGYFLQPKDKPSKTVPITRASPSSTPLATTPIPPLPAAPSPPGRTPLSSPLVTPRGKRLPLFSPLSSSARETINGTSAVPLAVTQGSSSSSSSSSEPPKKRVHFSLEEEDAQTLCPFVLQQEEAIENEVKETEEAISRWEVESEKVSALVKYLLRDQKHYEHQKEALEKNLLELRQTHHGFKTLREALGISAPSSKRAREEPSSAPSPDSIEEKAFLAKVYNLPTLNDDQENIHTARYEYRGSLYYQKQEILILEYFEKADHFLVTQSRDNPLWGSYKLLPLEVIVFVPSQEGSVYLARKEGGKYFPAVFKGGGCELQTLPGQLHPSLVLKARIQWVGSEEISEMTFNNLKDLLPFGPDHRFAQLLERDETDGGFFLREKKESSSSKRARSD